MKVSLCLLLTELKYNSVLIKYYFSFSSTALPVTEKSLTYKQLEDIINKWVHDLEEQEKVFLNQASQVNTWDCLLIENGEKVFYHQQILTSFEFDSQIS